ncbi:MAG: hypothetical protein NUV88_02915 [Candidatus Kaiserbacteria bacterium]|nr:hypothetical protein [Candidatus Kaiserbacteria bacterium]
MENPWENLPDNPPFILSEDMEAVETFNRKKAGTVLEIMLEQLPSPYTGNPEAPVVFLNGNPGYEPDDSDEQTQTLLNILSRANFLHQFGDYPFQPLNPQFANSIPSGYRWWTQRLKPLISAVGIGAQKVSERIFCAEYFPYHSKKYGWSGGVLPSQRYTVALVESALSRGAVIIIMRGKKVWLEAINALTKYPNVFTLNSPQYVIISEKNLGAEAFRRVITRIREG